jgi:hypothetical protein
MVSTLRISPGKFRSFRSNRIHHIFNRWNRLDRETQRIAALGKDIPPGCTALWQRSVPESPK